MATYRRISQQHEAPADAVTVGIAEGRGGVSATVSWPAVSHGASGSTPSGREGPYPAPVALARAEEVRRAHGFARIVVLLQRAEMWNPAWGGLSAGQMAKEPHGDLRDAAPTGGEPMNEDEFLDAATVQEQERDA